MQIISSNKAKNIDEKEPKYIINLRNDLKEHIDKGINRLEIKIETEVNELALMTANSFKKVYEEFGSMREEIAFIKHDINGIKVNISQINLNISEINLDMSGIRIDMPTKQELMPILQDHKFRITKLEKEALA